MIDNNIFKQLFNTLMDIQIPQQFEIINGVQMVINDLKFNDIFNFIKLKHYHCEEGKICPHNESLYEHLHNVANFAYIRSKKLNYSEHECKKAWITGLLHDIGKPGTININKKYISFKGHGIVGGAILNNLWSNEIFEKLGMTRHDWGDICTCTCVHMCGYFLEQETDEHIFNLKILPTSVKKILVPLRYGDYMGLFKKEDDESYKTNLELELLETECRFIKNINVDNSINNTEINDYLKVTKKNSIMIQVIGTSASGKSSFVNKLVNIIGKEKTTVISRDFYMINTINKHYGFDLINSTDDIVPLIYQRAYNIYINTNKELVSVINYNMLKACINNLNLGKIVIIDSMITMFSSVKNIIPDIALNAYKINFWLNRNKLLTSDESENRLGMSLEKQIIAHGDCNKFNPYKKDLVWINLISLTENIIIENNKSKAHLSVAIGWNNCMDHIINHLCEKVIDIYNYNYTLPKLPLLEDTNDMTLLELITLLKLTNNIDLFFKTHNYIVIKKYIDIIGIKYIDGLNKIWKPKWAREARGRFYYIGDQYGYLPIELKSGLQRGIEILTKEHINSGIIETQDIESKTYSSIFDETQQYILQLFTNDNPIDSYISAKVDGSLLIINIYPLESIQYNIILDLINNYTDDFSKELAYYCCNNNLPLITISTQGTLFIYDHMQEYFLTAVQSLINPIELTETLLLLWKSIIPEFVKLVLKYYGQIINIINDKEYISMFFEIYCKNRTTLTGNIHTELAISYNHNGFNLLGLTSQNIFTPHFDLPQTIFTQPFSLKITSTSQVFDIMKKIDNIIIDNDETNKIFSCVHPEGFVLLTKINNKYDYAKIKTKLYYDCHKIKENNIKNLLLLNSNCEKFYPIITKLKNFFNNFKPLIFKIVDESNNILMNEFNVDSPFYKCLSNKGQQRIDEVINILKLNDYDNPKILTIYKIYLNTKNANAYLISILKPLILNIFTDICGSIEDLILLIKMLLIKVEPWTCKWTNRLDNLILYDNDLINQFYKLVIGIHN